MKTTFFKIACVLLMMTIVNKSFAGNKPGRQEYTQLTWINSFYKIEAHGNVRLHLLYGEKNKVEMSGNYYNQNALVQVENGILRITCYHAERLDVWVTANDLRALDAYDNVLVQSEGKFSALELDVNLFNKAKADLDLDCCYSNIKLNDKSMADISGTAMQSQIDANYAATLNSADFNAGQLSENRIAPIWETRFEFAGAERPDGLSDVADDLQPLTVRSDSTTSGSKGVNIPSCVQAFKISQVLVN